VTLELLPPLAQSWDCSEWVVWTRLTASVKSSFELAPGETRLPLTRFSLDYSEVLAPLLRLFTVCRLHYAQQIARRQPDLSSRIVQHYPCIDYRFEHNLRTNRLASIACTEYVAYRIAVNTDFALSRRIITLFPWITACTVVQCSRLLWTTPLFYGNMRFLDPRPSVIPWQINMKFCTIDNVGKVTRCAKDDNKQFSGVCSPYTWHIFFLFFDTPTARTGTAT
jgi:hypothetical protein